MGTTSLGSFQSRYRALVSWTTNVSSFWFHFSRLKTLLTTLDVALVGKERRVRTLLNITLPRIKNTKTQGNYASYDIEPLEAGGRYDPGQSPATVVPLFPACASTNPFSHQTGPTVVLSYTT